jgi:twitching motility protein PilU
MNLAEMLVDMASQKASDLFISVDAPPMINVEGRMRALSDQLIDGDSANTLIRSILDEEQIEVFERDLELNIALQVPDAGRFRVNLFYQRGAPAAVCRFIKSKILSVTELGLPEKLNEIIMAERGLVLVVGGTSTGKSTTLAAMIDYRAKNLGGHILSIEDPIEFVHRHSKSLVNQREVGIDTHSYASALKNALREAPNVIMIGEVRDQDTMQQALTYAETGHLCVATLHANNANQALDRIISFFPEAAHAQILMDISMHLNAILSQRLCQGVDRKRVAAMELMFNTAHVSELIRQGKFDEIKQAMTRSEGMVHKTFELALYELYEQGKISEEEALRHADSRNNLSLKIRANRDAAGGTFGVEKELSYNRHAPFEHYHTFALNPLQVSRKRRDNADDVIREALIAGLEQKGLRHAPGGGDIEVQYSFGVEDIEALALEPIENESDQLSELTPDSDHKVTLLINIIDTRFGSDMWRLQAAKRIAADEPQLSQNEINDLFNELLKDYPALR